MEDAGYEASLQNPYVLDVDTLTSDAAGRLRVTYKTSSAANKRAQAEVKQKVDATVASITQSGMSDTQKTTAINDWLIDNVTYDYDALAQSDSGQPIAEGKFVAWNAHGALIEGTSVCGGYAAAFSALAHAAGLDAVVVTGDVVEGGRHAWNKVKVDGKWLAVDSTWNDSPDRARYLMINDNQFTDSATRSEDRYWMTDVLVPTFATS